MQRTIGLTYDLRSEYLAMGYKAEDVAEFDSDHTIEALESTIRSLGFQTDRIGHIRGLCARLVKGDRWTLVFNIAEGLHGRSRESQVPCILEAYEIPYTFSDPLVAAVTLDKAVAKRLVLFAGLRTPRYATVAAPPDLATVKLHYPLFAKPVAEGTGKGVDPESKVSDPAQLDRVCRRLLERYREPVLIEEYLPGREFTVGILGTGTRARALGTMEVEVLPHAKTTIYSYEVKEKCEDLVRYSRPARGPLIEAVEELAVQSYQVLDCRDAGRVDIRIDAEGHPSFMEVNPLPGLHPQHSDLPMIATQEGMPYSRLIGSILDSAFERAGTPTS